MNNMYYFCVPFKKRKTLIEKLISLFPPLGPYCHVEIIDNDSNSLKCSLNNPDDKNIIYKWNWVYDSHEWDVFYFKISKEEHHILVQEMKIIEGSKYDKWGLLTFPFRVNFSYGHRFFCSEAVARIMTRLGFRFKTKEYRMNPNNLFKQITKLDWHSAKINGIWHKRDEYVTK